MHFRSIILAAALLAAPATAVSAKTYAAIFKVAHNERGQLVTFELARVIDPASGKTEPVKVAVPQSFVDGARARSLSAKEAGKADEYFTYYIFDPARPADLYIEQF
jgi:hypothetical protein